MNNKQTPHVTLFELNNLVREIIENQLPYAYWVEAEISEMRQVKGHCYIELIQKDITGDTPIARASAKCWKNNWYEIYERFIRVTQQDIMPGMKILAQVYATFHEAYGFSWIITDINPEYSLGEMAQKRQMIIERLREQGVLDLQKQLTLSPFANRIAIISGSTAAGYEDFERQLKDNKHGLKFDTTLFQAVMQGGQTTPTIIEALDKIYQKEHLYDAIVIIRGGGATSDLSGFDTLALGENIANFPIPIITGIGHQRDSTVADQVAHIQAKTPTAAATLLVDNLYETYCMIKTCEYRIVQSTKKKLELENLRISTIKRRLPDTARLLLNKHNHTIREIHARIRNACNMRLTHHKGLMIPLRRQILHQARQLIITKRHQIEIIKQKIMAADPERLLERGYAITYDSKGHIIKDAGQICQGDVITTKLKKGSITSQTIKINKK